LFSLSIHTKSYITAGAREEIRPNAPEGFTGGFFMRTMDKGALPGQKEAIVQADDGIARDERLLHRRSEKGKEAGGAEVREVPDHLYATYWG
jgi:hypothetical protein